MSNSNTNETFLAGTHVLRIEGNARCEGIEVLLGESDKNEAEKILSRCLYKLTLCGFLKIRPKKECLKWDIAANATAFEIQVEKDRAVIFLKNGLCIGKFSFEESWKLSGVLNGNHIRVRYLPSCKFGIILQNWAI